MIRLLDHYLAGLSAHADDVDALLRAIEATTLKVEVLSLLAQEVFYGLCEADTVVSCAMTMPSDCASVSPSAAVMEARKGGT